MRQTPRFSRRSRARRTEWSQGRPETGAVFLLRGSSEAQNTYVSRSKARGSRLDAGAVSFSPSRGVRTHKKQPALTGSRLSPRRRCLSGLIIRSRSRLGSGPAAVQCFEGPPARDVLALRLPGLGPAPEIWRSRPAGPLAIRYIICKRSVGQRRPQTVICSTSTRRNLCSSTCAVQCMRCNLHSAIYAAQPMQ